MEGKGGEGFGFWVLGFGFWVVTLGFGLWSLDCLKEVARGRKIDPGPGGGVGVKPRLLRKECRFQWPHIHFSSRLESKRQARQQLPAARIQTRGTLSSLIFFMASVFVAILAILSRPR